VPAAGGDGAGALLIAAASLGPVVRRVLAISFAAPWVLWAGARVLGLEGVHPFVEAMAYTPFAAASSPLPVLAALVLRRWIVAAGAAVAAAALVLAIVPRAVFAVVLSLSSVPACTSQEPVHTPAAQLRPAAPPVATALK